MSGVVVWEENYKCFVRFPRPLHSLKFGQFTSLSGRQRILFIKPIVLWRSRSRRRRRRLA